MGTSGLGLRGSRPLAPVVCCLAAIALLLGSLPAHAVSLDVSFTADGYSVPVLIQSDPNSDISFVDQFQVTDPNGGWELTINALLDPDPQIVYAVSVQDFGAPSTFGFTFLQPIVPVAAPGTVSHQHSSSTTDAGGPVGTTVTALAPPLGIPVDADATPEIAVYVLSLNAGASYLSAGHDLSPSFFGVSPGDTQGSFFESGAGPAGAGLYDTMRVDVNFSMDGGGDAYTFNGTANVVPEPGTLALGTLGLLGLGALRARRSRD